MRKQDVIRQITKQTGGDADVNQFILETFFEVIKGAVSEGHTIYIRSFGSFGPKQRAAKVARNITQNTALQLDARTIPSFKPSPEFINQVRAQTVETVDEKATKSRAKKG